MKFLRRKLVLLIWLCALSARCATQEELENEVWLGMNQDDWPRVLRAIDAGVKFNSEMGESLQGQIFGKAVSRYWMPGGSNIVVQLLKRGVPVDIKSLQSTSLYWVLRNSQGEAPALLLLDYGAGKKLPLSERVDLLQTAAWCGYSNVVARLLDDGIPADSTNVVGYTVLMALLGGDVPMFRSWPAYREPEMVGLAKFMISRGAKLETKDQNGKTAADYAVELGRYDLLRLFDTSGRLESKYADVKKRSAQNKLRAAISERWYEMMG
jgi:hypothetical protein